MDLPMIQNPPPAKLSMFRRVCLLLLMGVCILYILNPGLGIFELLPDNIPIVGNLDEAGATALVIWAGRELFFRARSSR